MLELSGPAPRTLISRFTGTALNLYSPVGTIEIYMVVVHPIQDEEMSFYLSNLLFS